MSFKAATALMAKLHGSITLVTIIPHMYICMRTYIEIQFYHSFQYKARSHIDAHVYIEGEMSH